MRRSVKATIGVSAAALITATCTAGPAPAATRTVAENSGPAYFKMTGPKNIAHARALINRRTHEMSHVMDQIVKSKAPYGTASAIVAESAASDPGCTTAESAGRQMANTFNADDAAISRDQNNRSARRADLQRLVADLQSLQRQMATAEARARHQSVKAGISAMISDLGAFRASLQAIENANPSQSQVNQMATAAYKAQSDGQRFHTTCTAV